MSSTAKITIKAVDKFSKVFDKIKKGIKSNEKLFKQLGKSAKIAGVALAGAFAVGLKDAANFESALSDIGTLLDGDVNGQLQEMEDGIRRIARIVPKSPNELGAAAYDIVSAGIKGTAEQLMVLENSSKLAVAGIGTTEQAVDLVTSSLNSFGISAQESDSVAATLFATVQAGKTTVSELSMAFGDVAPIAKSTGVTFEELMASTAALTTTGLSASKVQRGLRQLFVEMTSDSGDLAGALKEVGITNVKAAIETDGYVAVLEKVKNELGLTEVEFGNLLGSVEAQTVATGILGEQNEAFKGTMAGMTGETDALNEAFSRQAGTLNNEVILAVNLTKEAFGVLAADALPLATGAVDLFNTNLGNMIETHNRVKTAVEGEKEGLEALKEIYNEQGKGMNKNSIIRGRFIDMLIKNQKLAIKETEAWVKKDTEGAEKIRKSRDKLGKKILEFTQENKKQLSKTSFDWTNVGNTIENTARSSNNELGLFIRDMKKDQADMRDELTETGAGFLENAKKIKQSSDEGASSVETASNLMASAFESAGFRIGTSAAETNATVSSEMQAPAASATTWGSHLLSNFVAGIKSMFPFLSGAIAEVTEIVNAIAFSTNPLMPTEIYGEHMIQNFAGGAIKATPLVQAAMGEIITIVNAFGQEVQVGVNDTAAVFEAYATEVDEVKKSHEELASEAGKAMANMTVAINDGVKEASDTIRELREELNGIFGEFGEKEGASQQKFAEAVVENEERISDIKKEIRESEDEVKKAQLMRELDREQEARERNLELIKSVEAQTTEIKRVNGLSRLEHSVEIFKKEREENQKWLGERLNAYNQELDQAKSKLPEIEALWEERKNLLTQYMGEEVGKSDELNGSIDRSIAQIRILMNQLEGLDNKTSEMGISVGSLGIQGARASGGPVSSNGSFLVGERGPELFTPNQSGNITPNGAGGGITININGPVSSEEAAEEMMDIVVRRLEQHVKVV